MPVAIKSSGGGSVTIAAGSTASDFTATLQSATGTIPVATPGTSGNLLTSDGTNWTSAAAPAPAAPDIQTFNTSGTWTKPVGYVATARVYVQVWGGGASGSRNSVTAENASGGGGGSYSSAWVALSSLGATETVTIGAGGASRTGSNQAGATGGDSSVGTFLAAGGGSAPSTASSNATTVTTAITGYTYNSEIAGGQGSGGSPQGTYYSGAGGAGVNDANVVGSAKTSRFGGAGGNGSLTTATAGTAPGGGGGGARSTSGAGAAGRVVISVYSS